MTFKTRFQTHQLILEGKVKEVECGGRRCKQKIPVTKEMIEMGKMTDRIGIQVVLCKGCHDDIANRRNQNS